MHQDKLINVLVIGRSGQLANELKETQPPELSVTLAGRTEIDLFDTNALIHYINQGQFAWVVNTSAYTAVDKAETDIDAAFALNEVAVRNLAYACKHHDIPLIHVSTDFVFGGQSSTPWSVRDKTAPQGVYANSKKAGERAIQETHPEKSVIVRTSWLYSTHGSNFVKTMLKVMNARSTLAVVDDQIGSPTYAWGLARFIWAVIDAKIEHQIFHWSDAEHTSWHGFAQEIANQAKSMGLLETLPEINKTSTAEYGAPAPRPPFSVLECSESYMLVKGVPWKENLHRMLTKLKNEEKKALN